LFFLPHAFALVLALVLALLLALLALVFTLNDIVVYLQ
jgi:hypothetical protein